MTESAQVPVLSYHQYLGPDSQTVYTTHNYCGSCRKKLPGSYAFPEEPEALEARNESSFGAIFSLSEDDRALEYVSFCPWCGVEFADEWWKDRTIQNERAIDHYQNPGHHKGDTHEFRGDGPDCIVGHWLGSTGDEVCWCEPDIEPGIMGCVIRHQDKRYEDVMALRREMESFEDEWGDDDD